MHNACSKERFLSDVRNHKMEVIKDDGVFRHISFKSPGTSAYRFALTTWPGYLAITGDCHDYVFCRNNDMFEFAREPIYPDYWLGKAVSLCKSGSTKTFSPELYKSYMRRALADHVSGMTFSKAKIVVRDFRNEISFDEVGSTSEAIEQAQEYLCPVSESRIFNDVWDARIEDYSFGFIWALRAIEWGVQQYDLTKNAAPKRSLFNWSKFIDHRFFRRASQR